MITAEVRRAVWASARDAAAGGELPPAGRDASSLRPVPVALGGGPGRYASTLPYLLTAGSDDPGRAARILAARLRDLPWIAGTAVTGPGYLMITVTDDALAALAVRITQAGAASARSDVLRGTTLPAPPPADLATATSWADARARLAAEVRADLARAAGAEILKDFSSERPASHPLLTLTPATDIPRALAFAGPDAVRYALLRMAPGSPVTDPERGPGQVATAGWPAAADAWGSARHHLGNPVYAVRYAHAHAASTLRQAADLGLAVGDAAGFRPCLLGCTAERALLGVLSWLPERVAGAARRGPRELARYLEELAGAYHDHRESCPALPFGGRAAPRDVGTIRARLWLVSAARTAIATGLALLGVSAPDRL